MGDLGEVLDYLKRLRRALDKNPSGLIRVVDITEVDLAIDEVEKAIGLLNSIDRLGDSEEVPVV